MNWSRAILLLIALPMGCNDPSGSSAGGESPRQSELNPPEILGSEAAVFLLIDEDSIDNGNPPNDFSTPDVNDDRAEVGERRPLRYFADHVGETIDLFTGQVGDEAWFALKRVPSSWADVGPTDNGLRNFVLAGPGLGDDDSEDLLDDVRRVTPLRATALAMLRGATIFAVVYDSDISINYSPLQGSLKGANLGIVALELLEARERRDGSTSDLPRVTVRILDAQAVHDFDLHLFGNAPEPSSSSEPFDIRPPLSAPQPVFDPAP
jgi:hypothetical protein